MNRTRTIETAAVKQFLVNTVKACRRVPRPRRMSAMSRAWPTLVGFLLFFARPDAAWASDLRDVSWGMSRLDVLAVEEAEAVSLKAPFIHYRSRISGRLHHLIYGFIEDRLASAVYIVVTRRPDEYRTLKRYVESKYGSPKKAYDGGSGNYRFFWDSDGQEITIRPGQLRECRIEYTAKHYKALRADKEKKRKKRIAEERWWAY